MLCLYFNNHHLRKVLAQSSLVERLAKKSRVLCWATGLEMAGSIGGPERRIFLVGGCGSGKSATGNTILGREVFEVHMLCWPGTQTCQKEEAQLNGRKVVVVDTPGFANVNCPVNYVAAEVRKRLRFCSPGPHVILHVMDPFYWTHEETDVIPRIQEALGFEAKDYTIPLFTFKDCFKRQSPEKIVSSGHKYVREYIDEYDKRYLLFNNKAKGEEREAQVAELMTMMDALVETNRDAPCYTEDMRNLN